ncbi:sensor histidine kinase [Paenibacillus sp. FSL H7-0331]|uniref:cache domain-containing sensor histidine kinase n=1 Tax=Paenibacillus sp. FSL H7-0331 TaxID=1920421 RepID=UPI00096E4AC9|nr:sensor histidine kinase [Paenibacillus sp. FSL H7-0331]OMF11034.1 hypothetical protein BK127_26080 [Paenibacillus sp. FSL H7-0331]
MNSRFQFLRKFSESVQWKLTGLFILVLIPLVFVSLYTISRSQHILEQQVGERTKGAMESAIQYIDSTPQGLEEQSVLLATDDNLNRILYGVGTELDSYSINEFRKAMSQISNVSNINRFISPISILHVDTNMLISSELGGVRLDSSYASSDWFNHVRESSGRTVLYIPDSSKPADSIFSKDSITFMRTMDLYGREREKHVLMLSVHKDKLLDLVKKITPSKNTQWYMLAGDDRMVASTSNSVSAPVWDGETDVQLTRMPGSEEQAVMFRIKSNISKWSLIMVQPEAEIYKETKQLRIFTLFIIVASALFALFIAAIFYTSLSLPLKKLLQGMMQIQIGNLNVRFTETRRDEFGYLMNAFNQMAAKQQYLIENIYEQNLRVAKTELKFLQSQINPHFLYNTLDSIYWMAKNYDANEISEMVINLSKFFRLSLDKGLETIALAETFEHLHYYIRVQQLRFMDKFEVQFALPDTCREIRILRLLVQPLVENAIIHGLEKKQRGGILRISASLDKASCRIDIFDNGKGISAEKLRDIQTRLAMIECADRSDEKRDSEVFGLRNVRSRLKLYYMEQAELRIESKENEWTRVTILVPLKRDL